MARAGTAARSNSASTEESTGTALALTSQDQLADYGDDANVEVDGLGEITSSDLKVTAYVLNMKGVGADGRQLPLDEYYNTIEESTKREVNAVLAVLHKTNLYQVYDEAEKKNKKLCRSYDQITGETTDEFPGGVITRKCEGCPDAKWGTNDKGKRTRNCSEVFNVTAVDRDTMQTFVVRFKRTSLPVITAHIQRHHFRKRLVVAPDGKRSMVNYPLFSFAVKLSAKMDPKGTHAVPIIEKGEVLPRDEFNFMRDGAKSLHEQMQEILERTESQAADAEETGGAGDTSFNPSDFGGSEGQDFAADAPAG